MALKTVMLSRGVELTRDDGEKVFYPAGLNAMPEADANHWYIATHVTADPEPVLGDRLFADGLRAAADKSRAAWGLIDAQALQAEEAWLQTQAAAASADVAADGEGAGEADAVGGPPRRRTAA